MSESEVFNVPRELSILGQAFDRPYIAPALAQLGSVVVEQLLARSTSTFMKPSPGSTHRKFALALTLDVLGHALVDLAAAIVANAADEQLGATPERATYEIPRSGATR